jgi:hypothetical protein
MEGETQAATAAAAATTTASQTASRAAAAVPLGRKLGALARAGRCQVRRSSGGLAARRVRVA